MPLKCHQSDLCRARSIPTDTLLGVAPRAFQGHSWASHDRTAGRGCPISTVEAVRRHQTRWDHWHSAHDAPDIVRRETDPPRFARNTPNCPTGLHRSRSPPETCRFTDEPDIPRLVLGPVEALPYSHPGSKPLPMNRTYLRRLSSAASRNELVSMTMHRTYLRPDCAFSEPAPTSDI